MKERGLVRIALFGAAPDTPNMGVSALFMSTITGISRYIDPVEFVVFDNGRGNRESYIDTPEGKPLRIIRFGARGGRRYYRQENIVSMLFASRLGRIGAFLNRGIGLIDTCDAVLDISGGDSFSDIYGRERFNNINIPKLIAANRKKNLILLPQTYGPYKASSAMQKAAVSVNNAMMAWARDRDSFDALKKLIGTGFDPQRHLCGVDMAFGLAPLPAEQHLTPLIRSWIKREIEMAPLIGFNVSGLIYNDPQGAQEKYSFRADYQRVVIDFLTRILKESSAKVVLISHVMDQPGHFESDIAACMDVAGRLESCSEGRIAVAPATFDQSQVKWLISQMDWFCGTRMHSTIASLSSSVPTAAISYSYKTRGVFETCSQEKHVMDPTKQTTEEIVNGLWRSFTERDAAKQSLKCSLPRVMSCLDDQLQAIVSRIAA